MSKELKVNSIYIVDSNTKYENYMKIWLKALDYKKTWNNTSNYTLRIKPQLNLLWTGGTLN